MWDRLTPNWISEEQLGLLFSVLGILSVATFLGSLILIPLLVAWMPTDYFLRRERPDTPWGRQHPAIRWSLLVAKNLLGLVLLIGGVMMLVLPGQGLLTILMGLVLMNYPGKRRLERYLVSRPAMLRAINWLRGRAHRPPLRLDPAARSQTPANG